MQQAAGGVPSTAVGSFAAIEVELQVPGTHLIPRRKVRICASNMCMQPTFDWIDSSVAVQEVVAVTPHWPAATRRRVGESDGVEGA